jgi:hypothetical protein
MIVEAVEITDVVTGVAVEKVTIGKVVAIRATFRATVAAVRLAETVRRRVRMRFSKPMAQPAVKQEPRVPLGLRDLLVSPGLLRRLVHPVSPELRVRRVLLKGLKVPASCVWF